MRKLGIIRALRRKNDNHRSQKNRTGLDEPEAEPAKPDADKRRDEKSVKWLHSLHPCNTLEPRCVGVVLENDVTPRRWTRISTAVTAAPEGRKQVIHSRREVPLIGRGLSLRNRIVRGALAQAMSLQTPFNSAPAQPSPELLVYPARRMRFVLWPTVTTTWSLETTA